MFSLVDVFCELLLQFCWRILFISWTFKIRYKNRDLFRIIQFREAAIIASVGDTGSKDDSYFQRQGRVWTHYKFHLNRSLDIF